MEFIAFLLQTLIYGVTVYSFWEPELSMHIFLLSIFIIEFCIILVYKFTKPKQLVFSRDIEENRQMELMIKYHLYQRP
jgi:heme A synthase